MNNATLALINYHNLYFSKMIARIVLCVCWVSLSWGQSFQLGENYLDQGEYEKAKAIFKSEYEKQPRSQKNMLAYVEALKALEEWEDAEKVLLRYLNGQTIFPTIDVELGRIYELQGKNELARERYQLAIASIHQNPNYAYSVGKVFQDYNLLEEAIEVYENANTIQPNVNYKIQLARIYGEQGELEKMFQNYLYLVVESPNFFNVVSRNFEEYITNNPENEANKVFKKLLLKELQSNPTLLYNQLLSWLFVQEGEYSKAFAQEKAIAKRSGEYGYQRLIDLGYIAAEATKNQEVFAPIFNYVETNSDNPRERMQAILGYMQQQVNHQQAAAYPALQNEFENYLANNKLNNADLSILYARFLAFKVQDKAAAKDVLNQLLDTPTSTFTEAGIKMVLADIFVLEEQFNQALIYYSQIEKLAKNTDIAQEAKYKIAKTSYYKGDFEWAVTQLDVLKNASSQLIANDAMALARHIKDNSYMDSIPLALQKVAKADLFTFQEKKEEALGILEEVLVEFKDGPIIDEALYRKAQLHTQLQQYEEAIEAYQGIVASFAFDSLADDAFMELGKIYEKQLQQPDLAKEAYEKIIFNYPDSIFFVDAQKAYRKLRGDAIN